MRIEGELRAFLQQRHGRKVEAKDVPRGVVAVGDMVSYLLLKENRSPHLCVFDFKTERNPIPEEMKRVLLRCKPIFVGRNRRGHIEEGLVRLLPSIAKIGGGLYIEGEEDALALPLVLLGYPVVYGRRGEGMFLIEGLEDHQLPREVKQLLKDLQKDREHV